MESIVFNIVTESIVAIYSNQTVRFNNGIFLLRTIPGQLRDSIVPVYVWFISRTS